MYTKDGESYCVVDEHVHFWDASPENQANVHGKQFIDCFYGYHTPLSHEEYLWSESKFQLKTNARAVVKLPTGVEPADIASHADAGLDRLSRPQEGPHEAASGH